ncbi:cation:proton antiporter [Micromonospora sagamiensis]|uniref:Sodium/proton antiporter, CPA1 family (TC 2.A.36) n=1 Tax=Micromonospora sagamiensis TaxID=47875 RepID=A0A562WJF1_9ACTN|nr:cation:proton antiporter [Micromonospora sagamiensis]TWJ30161.1 sodium/proton antiporter, CPA1 family (TC 2.A.36) [Micromonospora sagamiensis]BCL16807.1 cation transporter [Micromonospora sagamiensis]
MEPVDVAFAVLGIGALLAGILPRMLERRPLSMPIAFLGLGMVIFLLPTGLPIPDPLVHPDVATHLTEVGVIVALMGAGLKIDRPLSWRRWSSTWRLLAIAMPLCIAAVALLGWWWAGLVPATALLLGAALAPTDPVLAADVQVGEPTDVEDSEDEVRFALTSEAGLNDGLAFPFVYAAIAIASTSLAPADWLAEWITVDLLWKVGAGVAGGLLVGWLLGKLFFRAPSELRLARHAEGFLALAATFLAYGLVEVIGGYGFLAVFVAARAIRAAERTHQFHSVLHDFAEQVERLLTVLLLLLFGGAVVGGLLAPLTWQAALVGLALVFVVRPLTGWLSLRGAPGRPAEHWVIACFGIRGVGSFYYLAYATTKADFPQADLVWATAGLVVIVSVVVHGVASTPVMQMLDRAGERTGDPEQAEPALT